MTGIYRQLFFFSQEEEAIEDSDDEETQQCQNRDRKTRIAHGVSTLLGLALLSVTSLLKVGSDSFNAILTLGLLTTGWCAIYWSHKFYTCLKKRKQRTVAEPTTEATTEQKDGYIENCDRRLAIVRTHLLKYHIVVDSDTESDADSVETATVGGDSEETSTVGDDSAETVAVSDDSQ